MSAGADGPIANAAATRSPADRVAAGAFLPVQGGNAQRGAATPAREADRVRTRPRGGRHHTSAADGERIAMMREEIAVLRAERIAAATQRRVAGETVEPHDGAAAAVASAGAPPRDPGLRRLADEVAMGCSTLRHAAAFLSSVAHWMRTDGAFEDAASGDDPLRHIPPHPFLDPALLAEPPPWVQSRERQRGHGDAPTPPSALVARALVEESSRRVAHALTRLTAVAEEAGAERGSGSWLAMPNGPRFSPDAPSRRPAGARTEGEGRAEPVAARDVLPLADASPGQHATGIQPAGSAQAQPRRGLLAICSRGVSLRRIETPAAALTLAPALATPGPATPAASGPDFRDPTDAETKLSKPPTTRWRAAAAQMSPQPQAPPQPLAPAPEPTLLREVPWPGDADAAPQRDPDAADAAQYNSVLSFVKSLDIRARLAHAASPTEARSRRAHRPGPARPEGSPASRADRGASAPPSLARAVSPQRPAPGAAAVEASQAMLDQRRLQLQARLRQRQQPLRQPLVQDASPEASQRALAIVQPPLQSPAPDGAALPLDVALVAQSSAPAGIEGSADASSPAPGDGATPLPSRRRSSSAKLSPHAALASVANANMLVYSKPAAQASAARARRGSGAQQLMADAIFVASVRETVGNTTNRSKPDWAGGAVVIDTQWEGVHHRRGAARQPGARAAPATAWAGASGRAAQPPVGSKLHRALSRVLSQPSAELSPQ